MNPNNLEQEKTETNQNEEQDNILTKTRRDNDEQDNILTKTGGRTKVKGQYITGGTMKNRTRY